MWTCLREALDGRAPVAGAEVERRKGRAVPWARGAPYSSMGRATQIRRVEKWGDVEDFFDKGLPCIVTNGTLDWPAVEKWKKI